MKKILVVLAVLAMAMFAAHVAEASISGTLHNLASSSGNAVTGDVDEICVYCHTPHGGQAAGAAGQPLWNRTDSTLTSTFNLYTSATMSNPSVMNPASALCFSCHDGSIAVDTLLNVGGSSHTGTGNTVPGAFNIAADDMKNDHPIGVPLPSPKTGYFATPQNAAVAAAYTGASSKVECSVCHDVHGTLGFPHLLRMDNTGSLLCLTCHDK